MIVLLKFFPFLEKISYNEYHLRVKSIWRTPKDFSRTPGWEPAGIGK